MRVEHVTETAIFECLPNPSLLQAFYDKGKGINYIGDLVAGFEALNTDLTAQLDKHHTIGQTFFTRITDDRHRLGLLSRLVQADRTSGNLHTDASA